jgi:hypothetical protein
MPPTKRCCPWRTPRVEMCEKCLNYWRNAYPNGKPAHRPKGPRALVKSSSGHVRFTQKDWARIAEAAHAMKLNKSEWIRRIILSAL